MSSLNLDEGQDSFLDIVANLVGVLIILVVVVGAQATSSLVAEPKPMAAVEAEEITLEDDFAFEEKRSELKSELSSASVAENKFRMDRARLEMQANDEKEIAQKLATRRHAMLMQLEAVKAEHERQKKKINERLNEQQQRQLEMQSEKIQLVARLESLEESINAVQATRVESTVETIDHFPNPIAKTVFSNEVHFRLDRGKVSYVPMDELIELMKGELRFKAEKLKQANGTRETIGPVEGFRLRYELAVVPDSETGRPNSRIVRFKRFTIHPTNSSGGESIEKALSDNSRFANLLKRFEPSRTTVSIWVYPNSFEEHSKLKNWLHEHGYQMASWPLSEGRHISGGPSGFRTSAQ